VEENGPSHGPSPRGTRVAVSRGNGSLVSPSQVSRCGRVERRLYGGLCSAISRSSRTSASSAVVQGTASTCSDSRTISCILLRGSEAVK